MKKRIGISYTKTLFDNYWNWFTPQDLEDDLELIELSFEKNNMEDIYRCDGFVLTGGVDTHPSLYNGKTVYNNLPSSFQIERDHFEENIYHYSQLNKLPVLGICRGMQLINVLQGGKLIQDLDNGNERHKKEESDKEHAIVSEKNSLLYKISGSFTGHVNSAHHQAIDPNCIGDNLMVNAYDDDDEKIIEGLEFKNKTGKAFMLCVQWHPERMKDKKENPFSQNLKNQFLAAIRETALKKLLITNPATEEIITELNEDTKESLQRKYESLEAAQPGWHKAPLAERVEIIKKFSDLLEKNIEQLAITLTSEVGKPLLQSRNEINGAKARIKWLCENAEKYLSDEIMSSGNGMEEKISYEPWKIGSPIEEGIYIGPLSRKEQIIVLESQVKDAVDKGAIILSGGKKMSGKARLNDAVGQGYFFEPTVLVNVNHNMSIMKDESFGPVIGIMKVKDDDEAIRLMKDTEYGLTAAVYSSDKNRAENILQQINVGTGYWNCCDRVSAALPWSGRKHSGFGVTLSHAGLRAFTKPKGYHLRN